MDNRVLEIVLRARNEASKVLKQVAGDTEGLTKFFKNNIKEAGLMSTAALGGFVALGTMAARNAGELERLQVSLETVTGSVEEAEQAMKTIRRTAAESPFFETRTLAQFVQLMAASGQKIDQAVKASLAFGDVAAAFGKGNEEMSRMGNTLSQVIGKGRADVIDFRELVNAGWVSVRRDVAETMGITMVQFEEMVSAGEIGYDQIRQAADRFHGSAAKQSDTWQALLQRMNEGFNNFLADLIVDTGIFDSLKVGIEQLIALMDEWGPRIASVVEKLVANKEVVIAIAGAISGLLILALGALIFTFGTAIAIMAAVAAAGAVIAVGVYKLVEAYQTLAPMVAAAWQSVVSTVQTKASEIYNAFKAQFDRLPRLVQDVLSSIARAILNFNPIIRIGLELPDIVGQFNGLKERARKIGIPGFAGGTDYAPGGLAMVGERGPELVYLPRGSQVKSNEETRQIMGGGANVNIGPVYVRDQGDIESISHRLAFQFKTRGYL